MENQAFVIEQLYPAPTYKLWNAITDKDQMKRAMSDNLTHKRMTVMASSLPARQAGIWQIKNKIQTENYSYYCQDIDGFDVRICVNRLFFQTNERT